MASIAYKLLRAADASNIYKTIDINTFLFSLLSLSFSSLFYLFYVFFHEKPLRQWLDRIR